MMENPYALEHWIGEEIAALIPMLGPDTLWVTLRNVEYGGVWIESDRHPVSQFFRDMDKFDETAKVIVFVPFSQIIFVGILDKKAARRAAVLNFDSSSRTGQGACATEGDPS